MSITESTPLAAGDDWYGAAKVVRDQIVAEYAAYSPRHVVLRPSCIYGRGSQQWSGRISRLLLARRLGDLGAAGWRQISTGARSDYAIAAARVST